MGTGRVGGEGQGVAGGRVKEVDMENSERLEKMWEERESGSS